MWFYVSIAQIYFMAMVRNRMKKTHTNGEPVTSVVIFQIFRLLAFVLSPWPLLAIYLWL